MVVGLWKLCLKQLEQELSGQAFNTWIRPLHALDDNGTLRLLAPNRFVLERVQAEFAQRIEFMLAQMESESAPQVIFQVGSRRLIPTASSETLDTPTVETTSASTPHELLAGRHNQIHVDNCLNPQLNFTTFVPGKCNSLARSAAIQMAEQAQYNPLFIYGGVGLGKTHLMHAIGNQIIARHPRAKVVYASSERFVNHMVKALRKKSIGEFKKFYRSLDALLIDDVQFFANKTQSQEELLHTFNALVEKNKQIVIACDRLSQHLPGLNAPLQSRLGWGLSVPVEVPDFDTRYAILQEKAKQAQFDLPPEVGFYIAEQVRSNVRELEGALNRIFATARISPQPITLESAQADLQDLLRSYRPTLTLACIQKAVAEYFNISTEELTSRRRQRIYSRPRQIAMSLSKELTQHSLPEIGEAFGGRDHTTVLHSCKTVRKLKAEDTQVREDYQSLLDRLAGA